MNLQKQIKIRFEVPGLHSWGTMKEDLKDTPNEELLDEVGYLQYPHRHTFKFEVIFDVSHGNRDLEFIHMRNKTHSMIHNYFWHPDKGTYDFRENSCEMIAEWLLQRLKTEGYPVTEVSVSEDGEFYGVVRVVEDE